MKKQLAFTLLLSAMIGSNVFAQDNPKPAMEKKDNEVNALPQSQPLPAQPVINGNVKPAQKPSRSILGAAKPMSPASPDTKRPKTQALRAPMQEKIAEPMVDPKKQK